MDSRPMMANGGPAMDAKPTVVSIQLHSPPSPRMNRAPVSWSKLLTACHLQGCCERDPILYFFNQTPQLLFFSLHVLCGYYSRPPLFKGGYYSRRPLFKGSYYSRVATIQGWQIFHVWVIQWRLLDTASSKRSLSVLLSAVEMNRIMQTMNSASPVVIVRIICIHVRACVRLLFECGDYLRVASIQRNTLCALLPTWGKISTVH